jgi:hypothetical protein
MFQEIGFRVLEQTVAGSFFGPLKRAILSPVLAMARLCWGQSGGADVRIYLVQQMQANWNSTGVDSRYFERVAQ